MSKEYEPQTVKTLTRMAQQGLSKWGMAPNATAKLINLSENATFMATDPDNDRQIVVHPQRLSARRWPLSTLLLNIM